MAEKRILVFDDKKENLVVAKRVFRKSGVKGVFTRNYDEAIAQIERNKDSYAWVITDLFAPSSIDHKAALHDDILRVKEYADAVKRGENVEDEEISKCFSNTTNFGLRINTSVELRKLDGLDDNPSGLGIAEKCWEHNLPYRVLSDGNRHSGNLGIVRDAMWWSPTWKQRTSSGDPLYHMMAFGGVDDDKTKEETWRESLKRGSGLMEGTVK